MGEQQAGDKYLEGTCWRGAWESSCELSGYEGDRYGVEQAGKEQVDKFGVGHLGGDQRQQGPPKGHTVEDEQPETGGKDTIEFHEEIRKDPEKQRG